MNVMHTNRYTTPPHTSSALEEHKIITDITDKNIYIYVRTSFKKPTN